jgi:hypothetical protein
MCDLMNATAEIKPLDGLCGQCRGVFFVAPHALARRGETSDGVKPLCIEQFIGPWSGWRKTRPSLLYLGARHHTLEEQPRASVSECALGEAYKRTVHLVLRNGDGQLVQICSDHCYAPLEPDK